MARLAPNGKPYIVHILHTLARNTILNVPRSVPPTVPQPTFQRASAPRKPVAGRSQRPRPAARRHHECFGESFKTHGEVQARKRLGGNQSLDRSRTIRLPRRTRLVPSSDCLFIQTSSIVNTVATQEPSTSGTALNQRLVKECRRPPNSRGRGGGRGRTKANLRFEIFLVNSMT